MADPNYGLGQAEADRARAWAKERERKAKERDKKRRQRGQNDPEGGTKQGSGGDMPKSGGFIRGCEHIWLMPDGKMIGIGTLPDIVREVAMLKAEGRKPPGMVGVRYPGASAAGEFRGPGTTDLRKASVLGRPGSKS